MSNVPLVLYSARSSWLFGNLWHRHWLVRSWFYSSALHCAVVIVFTTVITHSLENGSVLLGDEHTFKCVADGAAHILWKINQKSILYFKQYQNLADDCFEMDDSFTNITSCSLESTLTIQSTCMELHKEFKVECIFQNYLNEEKNSISFLQVFGK